MPAMWHVALLLIHQILFNPDVELLPHHSKR